MQFTRIVTLVKILTFNFLVCLLLELFFSNLLLNLVNICCFSNTKWHSLKNMGKQSEIPLFTLMLWNHCLVCCRHLLNCLQPLPGHTRPFSQCQSRMHHNQEENVLGCILAWQWWKPYAIRKPRRLPAIDIGVSTCDSEQSYFQLFGHIFKLYPGICGIH